MTLAALLLVVNLPQLATDRPAARVEATVVVAPTGLAADDRPVTVTATPVDHAGDEARLPVEVKGSLGKSMTLRLAPGLWRLTADAEGLWSLPAELQLETSAAATIRAWPVGLLQGSFASVPGRRGSLPGRVEASVEILGLGDPGRFVATESCGVERGRWECRLPATRLVVRLKPNGFVPRYLHDLSVSAAKPSRVPPLLLERGSSIVGRVIDAQTQEPAARANVDLRSANGEPLGPPFATTADESGFFQLVTPNPATYTVRADEEGRSAASEPFSVGADDDVRLSEPLGLRPPLTLRVRTDPPLDPDGMEWKIRLVRVEGVEARLVVLDSPVDRRGVWTRPNLAEGRYLIRLSMSSGTTWATKVVDLHPYTEEQEIQAQSCSLRGTVRIGGEPVRARIVLGGDRAPLNLAFQGDEDGNFGGIIPCREDLTTREWSFVVEAGGRRRVAHGVKLAGDAGEFRASLQLSDSAIEMLVVDESGADVEKAVITVVNAAHPEQMQQAGPNEFDSPGRLTMAGLEDGAYLAQARADHGRVSEQLRFEVAPTSRRQTVQLVVSEQLALSGVVVTPDGSPVAFARLRTLPTQAVFHLAKEVQSDMSGRFQSLLPSATRELALTASAYGAAFRIARVRVEPGQPLVVRLEPAGGTLVLNHDEPLMSDVGTYVLREGSFVDARTLQNWAAVHGQGQPDGAAVIPQMQEGQYHVCRVPTSDAAILFSGQVPARCTGGYLTPGHQLELRVPLASR